ncbi:MAG: virulence protein [Eubacteriales bacterium]|nr:virulence protein [Eubacteriales bacterium]
MQIKYHLEGSERKALLAAMREILQDAPKYMGPPSFAFTVGPYTIDRHGTLNCPDDVDTAQIEMLIHELEHDGFIGERIGEPVQTQVNVIATTPNDLDRLAIEMPKDGMTPIALENLRRLVASKAMLLKKALGTDSLPITEHEDRIEFGWFRPTDEQTEIGAYYQLVQKLCEMAKAQKRVTATEQPVNNEKYAFRCFLLRLGFIGAEYKEARKILLKNLSGNSAFKDAQKAEADL